MCNLWGLEDGLYGDIFYMHFQKTMKKAFL